MFIFAGIFCRIEVTETSISHMIILTDYGDFTSHRLYKTSNIVDIMSTI